jgi:hypothetical protein
MDTATAEIKIIDRRFMVRPTRDRAHEQELIEHKLTMVDVTFGEM